MKALFHYLAELWKRFLDDLKDALDRGGGPPESPA